MLLSVVQQPVWRQPAARRPTGTRSGRTALCRGGARPGGSEEDNQQAPDWVFSRRDGAGRAGDLAGTLGLTLGAGRGPVALLPGKTAKPLALPGGFSQPSDSPEVADGAAAAPGLRRLDATTANNMLLDAAFGRPASVPQDVAMRLPLSSSPRRTMKIRFTCNACGFRTARAINPNAYATGTVFVQCEGCQVHHKLVDNLKLYHEMQGQVYTPPPFDKLPSEQWLGGYDVLGGDA